MKTLKFFVVLKIFTVLALCSGEAMTQDDEKKEIPEPRKITLKTGDNVNLVCNFFGGTKEKESVPVILLHDFGGKKEEYTPFAQYLQRSFGFAVIVPDLRGHGESTKTVTNQLIDPSKFRKNDYATFNEDISTCFRYLRDEVNNEGEANIDMLCVVAAGTLCINATAWTLEDYSYQPIGGKKQGQFVKGLVFLNPKKSIKGFSITQLIKTPLFSGKGVSPVPLLIAVGDEDEKSYRDGKSIHTTLKRTHPKFDDIADPKARFKKMTLFLGEYENAAGTGLLDPDNRTKLEIFIVQFIQYKILANQNETPWVNYTKKE